MTKRQFKQQQRDLFGALLKIQLIGRCVKCGRQIVSIENSQTNTVESEYMNQAGLCFDCAAYSPKRRTRDV